MMLSGRVIMFAIDQSTLQFYISDINHAINLQLENIAVYLCIYRKSTLVFKKN